MIECKYCGESITKGIDEEFCSSNHKKYFEQAVQKKEPIPLRVYPKLVIFSKKYDKIPEVLKELRVKHSVDACIARAPVQFNNSFSEY